MMQRPAETTRLRYPASGHILRYARLAVDATDPEHTEGLMPALGDMTDASGGIRLGAISLLADYVAGVSALRTVTPDWTVTHDMALHLTGVAPPEGELEALCTITRAGRNNVVSETSITSPVTGEVARAFVTFTRLPRRDDTPSASSSAVVNLAEDPDVERPRTGLDEAIGFRLRHDGDDIHAEFDHTPFVVNSVGAIQGGVVSLAMERAASWAGEAITGRPHHTTDLHLHYLALGKDGPFQARAEILRSSAGSVVSRVALVDSGNDDRVLALGVATAEGI